MAQRRVPVKSHSELLDANRRLEYEVAHRERIEAALRDSSEQLRRLIETANDAVVTIDERGCVSVWNAMAEKTFGWSAEEAHGRPVADLVIPPEHRAAHTAGLARFLATGASSMLNRRVELDAMRKDGSRIPIELSIWPVKTRSGFLFSAFLRDISRRRTLQQSLESALTDRETILENSLAGILFLDAENHVRWANRTLEQQMFGYAPGELVGKKTEVGYLTRSDYEAMTAAAYPVIAAGGSFETELQMRRKDGSGFWVQVSGKAVDPKAFERGTVWVLRDISAQKRLAEELNTTLAQREAILETTVVGIGFVQGALIRWANSTLEQQMLGYARGELIGRHSEVTFRDHEAWADFLKICVPLLQQGRGYETEMEMRRKDGALFWCIFSGRAIDSSDLNRGSIWSMIDITERKRAEHEIRKALERERELSELKSRFVSMTSHEFRTPLAAILSSAELLEDYGERLPAEKQQALFNHIKGAVKRMTGMLDQVLAIGRSDAGRMECKPAPVAVAEFCAQLAEELRLGLGSAHRITCSVDAAAGTRLLDADLLRLVLNNLLTNAIKYSPQGSEVKADVRIEQGAGGDQLVFEVTDQGIGIPAADHAQIFQSFHRAHNVGNTAGAGLGLAIAKRAVDLHQGSIGFDSVPAGGTRFRMILPARTA